MILTQTGSGPADQVNSIAGIGRATGRDVGPRWPKSETETMEEKFQLCCTAVLMLSGIAITFFVWAWAVDAIGTAIGV